MEFFPANRACRKSASCSSITVCCRRKIGACPGTREPKRKKRFVMETWNLDGAEGVAVFCSSSFYCSHFSNVFWLSTGGGASAALLQKVHFCFAMPSYCRSEFRVLICMAYCGRKEHQRKEDGYIGRQFVFKSSKRKVGCAMLRYDTLQLRLSQGSELRLSPAWIHEVIISHYFENSLLAGGLGCSSAKSSVFTSL